MRQYDMESSSLTLLMKGFNDAEVGAVVKFAARNSDIIRGLIFSQLLFTGRASDNPLREACENGVLSRK